MSQSVENTIKYSDDLPSKLAEFKKENNITKENSTNLIIYYELNGERIVINDKDDYQIIRNKILKTKKEIPFTIIDRKKFKPNIKFEKVDNDPSIQCDEDEIKKEIDAKITKAKEKIAVILKNKEHMVEEVKKEMIREINRLYAGDDGIDIFCANYFNKALIEKMRQELDIDLLEGVPLKDSSANEELRDTECSFCKKNNNDKMYKNDIDQNYICNNCYEVLKEYYPADYIKLHNKIE